MYLVLFCLLFSLHCLFTFSLHWWECVCTFDQINTSIICFVFPLFALNFYCFYLLHLFLKGSSFSSLLFALIYFYLLKCCSFINLASFFDKFLDLLRWRYCFLFFIIIIWSQRSIRHAHTEFSVLLIDLRFQFCLRWGPKSVVFCYTCTVTYCFALFSILFVLNVCDGSGFLLLIFLFFLICPCAEFVFFFFMFSEGVFVWVNLNCFSLFYLCMCDSEWSRSLFILKNIISLFSSWWLWMF